MSDTTSEPSRLRFAEALAPRRALRPGDVLTDLGHFAIVSYTVDPQRLQRLIHPRFAPDCIVDGTGRPRALVSVVPFEDQDFHFAGAPWLRLRFGQTNYRAYVTDRLTGRRLVWFFGTTLDSWSVAVPRWIWRLPWHRGRIRFSCRWDVAGRRYQTYRMRTRSAWAPAALELADTGRPPERLDGFDDLEHALVLLTHPLQGCFYRRDGRLGTYQVWHARLTPSQGRCVFAAFPLLERLGLLSLAEQQRPHSVLIQPLTTFAIYLPPRLL